MFFLHESITNTLFWWVVGGYHQTLVSLSFIYLKLYNVEFGIDRAAGKLKEGSPRKMEP